MYKKVVVFLVLLGLFSLTLSACAIRDVSNVAAGPSVHMGGASFIQTSITLHKGDMLTLVDDASSPHIVTNGSWEGTTQKPAKESGAPAVNANFVGNDSGAVGPFNTAGTFHLYCTIHPRIDLTVTVQ